MQELCLSCATHCHKYAQTGDADRAQDTTPGLPMSDGLRPA